MTSSKLVYRQFAARQHRILAFYLATQALRAGMLGVILSNDLVKCYIHKSGLKKERLDWLETDTAEWFETERDDGHVRFTLKCKSLLNSNGYDHYLRWSRPIDEQTCVSELSLHLIGFGPMPEISPSRKRQVKKKAAARKRADRLR